MMRPLQIHYIEHMSEIRKCNRNNSSLASVIFVYCAIILFIRAIDNNHLSSLLFMR